VRYAITMRNDAICMHFGKCEYFLLIDIEDKEVKRTEKVENPGHHMVSLPKFLKMKGVECVISGGMGVRAMNHLAEYGINVILGVDAPLNEVIERLKEGSLEGKDSLCNCHHSKRGADKHNSCWHEDEKC